MWLRFASLARRLASSSLIRVMGGSPGGLAGFRDRAAVMVENLGLVGEESFAAIGANGKCRRRRSGCRRRRFAEGRGQSGKTRAKQVQATRRRVSGRG